MQKHVIKKLDHIDLIGHKCVIRLFNVVLYVHMSWRLRDATPEGSRWKVFTPGPEPSTWTLRPDRLAQTPPLEEGMLYKIRSQGLAGLCYLDADGLSDKLVGSGPLRGYEALPDYHPEEKRKP